MTPLAKMANLAKRVMTIQQETTITSNNVGIKITTIQRY